MTEKLLEWIRENANTEFGKQHQFREIHSVTDYQCHVPLSEYSDYKDAIQRMYAGEANVLTTYPVYCFVRTSGSTGEPKKIPLTREGLVSFADRYTDIMRYVEGIEGKHIHLSVFSALPGGKDREMMMSAAAYRYLCEQGKLCPEQYVGGRDLLFSKECGNMIYAKLWTALQEEDVVSIQSIFLYDVLLFFEYLREHGTEMLFAMKTGVIPAEINLSEEMKKRLLSKYCPSKQRIQFLQSEFQRGYEAIAPRIWKKLHMVSGIGGSFFRSREKLLRKYTGRVPWQYFFYGSSECLIAYAEKLECPYYTLMPESGYYEFLDRDTGNVYTMDEVRENEPYELIITNRSGLYRYLQGDMVRICGWQNGMPILEVLGRKNQVLNVAGEKTDAAMLEMAVLRLSEELRIALYDYAVAAGESVFPVRYLLYLELKWGPVRESVEKMSWAFDRILREINPDYDDLRNLGSLAMPQVICMRRGELESRKKYRNLSQNKPGQPILQNDR